MPRESAAALSVVPVQALARVAVPGGLTPVQERLFLDCINSKPAEWFSPDNVPVLVEYVRAWEMCELLEDRIRVALAGGETAEIKTLMQLRDMESKRMLQLATKLRLTQQSRYTPQAAATAARGSTGSTKPWQRVRRDES